MTDTRTAEPIGRVSPVDLSNPHLVGIGGAGMAAVAELHRARGVPVTGSDTVQSAAAREIRVRGCIVHDEHTAHNVIAASAVVVSTAIGEDNLEVRAARELGIPVVHRAQALDELMRGYRSVAVTGTHGKTTTTAMLAHVLARVGLDPSWAFGADLVGSGPLSRAHQGAGHILVGEVDESDRSFLLVRPDIAVVTNIDHDHPENYAGVQATVEAFAEFIGNVPDGGALVACADDPQVRKLLDSWGGQKPVTYGAHPGAAWSITGTQSRRWSSVIELRGPAVGGVRLVVPVPGLHQAHAAVAAVVTAVTLGVDVGQAVAAVESFPGVERRLSIAGEVGEVTVLDSFAHHPASMRLDLAAAREIARPGGSVHVVFEPAGAGRVAMYGQAMRAALAQGADYAAVLQPGPGVCGEAADSAELKGTGVTLTMPERALDDIAGTARPGDVVVLMGTTSRVAGLAATVLDRLTRRPELALS